MLDITPWHIESREGEDRSYLESVFSQGNGYMGVRGYRPDQRGKHPAWRSTFLAGFYEYIRPGITDLVNQPDFSALQFTLNGTDSEELEISDLRQRLDMRLGLVAWEYTLTGPNSCRTQVRQERFLSMADRHMAAIRLTLAPVNWSGEATVYGGIDGDVVNLPISDDQLTENVEFTRLWERVTPETLPSGGILTAVTGVSHRKSVLGYLLCGEGECHTRTSERGVATEIRAALSMGKAWSCEKYVAVACYRDKAPEDIVRDRLFSLQGNDFSQLLAQSTQVWDQIWRDADIQIEGNGEWQGALRYNIFQLIQAMPYGDPHASIGARGLTHGRYKGCYFWDTEIFMLPFFAHVQPEAAKSLLEYRYNTLPDAIESAKRFSAKGARYSWMASDTGYEQCETWDTGCCEVHITADVAYAVSQYCTLTGDSVFLQNCGAEMLMETARYWVDRFNYSAKEDRYHLLFVKGPDEYCGVTVDDFYTVSLARDNLEQAAEAADRLEREAPAAWKKLLEKIQLRPEERDQWRDIAAKVVLCRDASSGVWRQDATFALLEPLDIRSCKEDCVPLYHKISFDRLQRYQVLKQPAVLMYMALRPDRFSQEEMEAAWEYYEPKTLHDSTLSFGIHALVAARLGSTTEAVRYFERSLFLDLRDVMKNTGREGIHTASLGATWQAAVLGFGGLTVRDGQLSAKEHLPNDIQEMRFHIVFQGKRYGVLLRKGEKEEIFLDT